MGGSYLVTESGLEFQHDPQDLPDAPCSPQVYLERFRSSFALNILEQPSDNELVFELIHVDTSFANALRRILLAEVPTVAIEHVYMWNNSSLIHDEVLSHRLGLIPLNIDARLLDETSDAADATPTDRNTVVFRLAVTCSKDNKKAKRPRGQQQSWQDEDDDDHRDKATTVNDDDDDSDDSEDDAVVEQNAEWEAVAHEVAQDSKTLYAKDRPYTKHVYSKDLVWVPQGDQESVLHNVRPLHDDILIAKLRPGQVIELEAHARRGIGKDHAKFSPVATASYRLMPKIEILHNIYDELAQELVYKYEPGVFELVATDKSDPPGTRQKAKVCNPYACSMSRNYAQNAQLKASIKMSRIPDHFIFSVESVGMHSPGVLVAEALRVLQAKCQRILDLVEESTMIQQQP